MRSSWASVRQPLAQVVARIADLGQDPQRRGDPRDRGALAEHLDDPLQDGVVEREVAGAALLLTRAHHQRQHVGQGLAAEPPGGVQPRQVGGQHPHQRVVAARGGQAEQVVRDRALGEVDHGQPGARREPGRAHRGDRGRPARQRAAHHVDPVHVGRYGDGVPLALARVGALPALPVAVGGEVGRLGGVALTLPGGPEPLGPGALLGQPRPYGEFVLPERVAGDAEHDRAGDHRHRGERPRQHADEPAQQEEGHADAPARRRDAQRAARQVLARPPFERRRLRGLRRLRPPGRRARVGMHLCVAPADVHAVGLDEPRHRGPARLVRHS